LKCNFFLYKRIKKEKMSIHYYILKIFWRKQKIDLEHYGKVFILLRANICKNTEGWEREREQVRDSKRASEREREKERGRKRERARERAKAKAKESAR
jgi:hypothetical protein